LDRVEKSEYRKLKAGPKKKLQIIRKTMLWRGNRLDFVFKYQERLKGRGEVGGGEYSQKFPIKGNGRIQLQTYANRSEGNGKESLGKGKKKRVELVRGQPHSPKADHSGPNLPEKGKPNSPRGKLEKKRDGSHYNGRK